MSEFRFNDADNWASITPRSDLIGKFLVTYLRNHFSEPSLMVYESLKSLSWDDTPKSPIVIAPAHLFDPTMTEHRPGIFVKDNEVKPGPRLSIGRKEQGGFDLSGTRAKASLQIGSHTLLCVSSIQDQAKLIAQEVEDELDGYAEDIREGLRLTRWEWVGTAGSTQVEEARENYVCAVTFGYTFTKRILLRPQTPPLQRVQLTTSNQLSAG